MNTLAKELAKSLPRDCDWPKDARAATRWQAAKRQALGEVLRIKPGMAVDSKFSPRYEPKHAEKDGVKATFWMLKLNERWTVPVVELVKGEAKGTTLVVSDKGRAATAVEVDRLPRGGQRVLAADLFYFGEGMPKTHGSLWALPIATVGERLGLQANELLSIARWAQGQRGPRNSRRCQWSEDQRDRPVRRGALEEKAIGRVELIAPARESQRGDRAESHVGAVA